MSNKGKPFLLLDHKVRVKIKKIEAECTGRGKIMKDFA